MRAMDLQRIATNESPSHTGPAELQRAVRVEVSDARRAVRRGLDRAVPVPRERVRAVREEALAKGAAQRGRLALRTLALEFQTAPPRMLFPVAHTEARYVVSS